jgi:hypothetical protein
VCARRLFPELKLARFEEALDAVVNTRPMRDSVLALLEETLKLRLGYR